MRLALLLIALFAAASVSRARDITSRELIGTWTSGTPSHGDWRFFTFRADHSFDGIGGDARSAGKWKLHGNKLELILHYDYEREPISRLSRREWAIIESISKNCMRVRWYSSEYNKDISPAPDVKPLPPELWTKRR